MWHMSRARAVVAGALAAMAWVSLTANSAPASDADYLIGVARVDVTPEHPVRLSGYGNRRTESEGVEQRLWAKALALGRGETDAAVLLTVEVLAGLGMLNLYFRDVVGIRYEPRLRAVGQETFG